MTSERRLVCLRCAPIIGVILFVPCAKAQLAQVSNVMSAAVSARDALPPADGSLWRFEGPTGILNGLHNGLGLAPFSGRINEVAIDPRAQMIMYATGATGGVWKTVNAGQSWTPLSADFPIQSATAVAIDPFNTSHVFVITGDYRRPPDTEPFSVGVMRSLDGGLSWAQFGQDQMRDFTVSRIVLDPRKGQEAVYAATGRGGRLPGGNVFRSTTDGATWSSVGLPDANWDDLERCSDGFLWAAATQKTNLTSDGAAGSGLLYKSSDGVFWFPVQLVTPTFNLGTVRPIKLHIACGTTSLGNVVFVAIAQDASARIFGTTDGATWTQVGSVNTGSGSWAHSAFGVTFDFLFYGGTSLFTAPLPGALGPMVFTDVNTGSDRVPGDIQCIVPDPTERNAIFVCDDKGLYRRSATTGLTSLNATLGVTQIWGMDVHPRNGNLIAIGEQDFGSSVSFFGQGRDAVPINTPSWGVVNANDGTHAVFKGDKSSDVFTSNRNQVRAYRGQTGPPLSPVENTDSPPIANFNPSSNAPLLYRGDLDMLSVPGPTSLSKFTHLTFTQADASDAPANGQLFGLVGPDRVIS